MTTLKATAVIKSDDGITVWTEWSGAKLDRPIVHGIAVRNQREADRLARAIDAQVVYSNPRVTRDAFGHTYVDATCVLYVRHLNASLNKLGY